MQAAPLFFFSFNFTGTFYLCETTDISSIAWDKTCWEVLNFFFIQLMTMYPYGYNTSKNIEGMVSNQPQWKKMASIAIFSSQKSNGWKNSIAKYYRGPLQEIAE